jgi:hypothetical protein
MTLDSRCKDAKRICRVEASIGIIECMSWPNNCTFFFGGGGERGVTGVIHERGSQDLYLTAPMIFDWLFYKLNLR